MTTVRLLHMHGQTHTHRRVFLFTTECQTFPYIYASARLSVCQHITAQPSIHPSIQANLPFISPPASPLPFIHTSQAYSKVTHLNYPGCAHTHSKKNTHTQHAQSQSRSKKGSAIGRRDKEGGGEYRFHATLSSG